MDGPQEIPNFSKLFPLRYWYMLATAHIKPLIGLAWSLLSQKVNQKSNYLPPARISTQLRIVASILTLTEETSNGGGWRVFKKTGCRGQAAARRDSD